MQDPGNAHLLSNSCYTNVNRCQQRGSTKKKKDKKDGNRKRHQVAEAAQGKDQLLTTPDQIDVSLPDRAIAASSKATVSNSQKKDRIGEPVLLPNSSKTFESG